MATLASAAADNATNDAAHDGGFRSWWSALRRRPPDLHDRAAWDWEAAQATRARVDELIGWYDRNARWARFQYVLLRIVTIVVAASIPVVAGMGDVVLGQAEGSAAGTPALGRLTLAAVLGVVIVVAEGLQQVLQSHENWIRFRDAAEALEHEKFLFIAGAGEYDRLPREAAFRRLARFAELITSQERSRWTAAEISRLERGPGDFQRADGMTGTKGTGPASSIDPAQVGSAN
jgi:hypothetical protein